MVQTRQDTERALAMIENRIARFSNLEPDWDSYGAKTISPKAITAAQEVLRTLIRSAAPVIGERILSASIAPLPNGGVLLEWHGPTADLEVEVTANGALDILLEKRVNGNREYFERADVHIEYVASQLSGILLA